MEMTDACLLRLLFAGGSGNHERLLLAESGRFGLPLAPLDTCMRRFDLSRPNPAVRRNSLVMDTLSANRVVFQKT
jgi:hypothetical protein